MRGFRILGTVLLIVCLASLVSFVALRSGPNAPDSPWHDWSTLHLNAKMGAFGSGRLEMHLRGEDGKRVVETSATAKFMGVRVGRTRTTSVLGAGGTTESHERYSKERGRRYLFGEDGYRVEKLKSEKGFEAPPEDWNVYYTKEYTYPSEDGRTVRPYDYYAMLLRLRDAGLDEPGDEVVLHVAGTDGSEPYRVEVMESRTNERTWLDLATGDERTEAVRELRITITPTDPDSDEGFMKMQGQTEIWVEADSKAPIEINGKVPRVGHVRMKLHAMRSGNPSR